MSDFEFLSLKNSHKNATHAQNFEKQRWIPWMSTEMDSQIIDKICEIL